MLTADLVTVRRRGDELRLPVAGDGRRARVAALAAALAATARQQIGRTRDEVEESLRETAAAFDEDSGGAAGDRKLTSAVGKLVRDGLAFEETPAEAATELRRHLFRRAAARRAAGPGPFDRAAILNEVAGERQTTAAGLEQGLFADRPGAQRLRAVELPSPTALAAGFEIAEAQAVLLRATKVIAEVQAGDASSYRHLFRRLKFLRLLPVIERTKTGYRVQMDGPLSLFQAGARYGLQLALALPAIAACDVWTIDLEPAVLDLPGAGLCVPDLAFVRSRDGARVAFELLGFWSREAVFRRVDLVRAGLPHRILFAASKSLRVGEALLDDAPTAALYVFTRVLSVRAVVERLEKLAAP